MSEHVAEPLAPKRVRKVQVPRSGSRLTLAAALGLVVIVSALIGLPSGLFRTLLLILGAPLFPLGLTFALGMAPRIFAERAAARGARRAWRQSLADASKAGRPVLLSGRLQPKVAIRSPKGVECAAWVERTESEGSVVQTSQVGEAVLKSKRFGEIPLETGRWRLQNPFDPFDEKGEASIAVGEPVVIRARVQSFNMRGDGYRDNAVGFRLRAGGVISPKSGRFSRRVVAEVRWLLGGATVALGTFTVSLVVLGSTSLTPDVVNADRAAATATTAPSAPACNDDRACNDGLVCDGETMECVKAIQGTLAEGETCARRGDCGAGLRCRPNHAKQMKSMHCTRPCKADSQCKSGDWCVPCMAPGQAMPATGDCEPSSQIPGAVGVLCKMVHGQIDAERH